MSMVLGDNYRFDVSGAPLEVSLELAFLGKQTVVGWREQKREGEPPRLILYWHEGREMTPTPVPLSKDAVIALVQQWVDSAEWEPNHPWNDVTTRRGARVYNENWGHIDEDPSAFVAIEPFQVWIGK